MVSVPPSLEPIRTYFDRASELKSQHPFVAHYVRLFGMELAMKLRHNDAGPFLLDQARRVAHCSRAHCAQRELLSGLFSQMEQLEKEKVQIKPPKIRVAAPAASAAPARGQASATATAAVSPAAEYSKAQDAEAAAPAPVTPTHEANKAGETSCAPFPFAPHPPGKWLVRTPVRLAREAWLSGLVRWCLHLEDERLGCARSVARGPCRSAARSAARGSRRGHAAC